MKVLMRARLGLGALLTLVLLVAGSSAATADSRKPHHQDKRQLTVMTQNLYLGSSLTPAITATTPAAFIAAVAQIYGTAVSTNFPQRASAIADTIAAGQPDLVGLQEVTNWIASGPGQVSALPSFDFLSILQAELTKRGLDYSVAAVSQNANIGPAPLAGITLLTAEAGCSAPNPAAPAAWLPDCFVTLEDRDNVFGH